MKKLKGAKVLETSVQKTVQGGLKPRLCNDISNNCPTGQCCDFHTGRCFVIPHPRLQCMY